MTVPAGTPGDEVPEADWAEQEADAATVGEDPTGPVGAASTREADEADLAESELTVDYGDDEQ